MATSTVELPSGFELDSPHDLPSGFVIDAPAPAPREGGPVPSEGAPKGFYAVTGDDGKKTLRRDLNWRDTVRVLSDLPGVGLAERLGAGATNLAGKAASGLTGLVTGDPDTVRKVQQATHVDLPASNDPLVQASDKLSQVASQVAKPVDAAVGNLPPGPRTVIESTEEAIPDIASIVGLKGAFPEQVRASEIARSPIEVAKAAGYTGLRTKGDLLAPGNQTITDTLIGKDAGIVPGQKPSVAALENARRVGPGRIYDLTENSLPSKLTQDDALREDLSNLPDQVSQLPRSPDVDALQEAMLSQPQMSKDELFANIREARERAKQHWKSDDPDKAALGDAYSHLANSYESFVDRQLESADAPVTLDEWRQARVQMAKNYQAQGALRGEHFDAQAYGRTAERNPHLLTGNAAIVGHVANGLPSSGLVGMADIGPAAGGALAGEALGQHVGAPGVGAVTGAVVAPMVRAKLQQLLTRGRPELAEGTSTNPSLSYFFDQGKPPSGWNRSPITPQIAGLLPSPSMVNAGGGATTSNTLEHLGLTPDVQAAGAAHPAAARLRALQEQLSRAPMETVNFQAPQKWGDFSLAPDAPKNLPPAGGIPFENVLEQGGTERPPVGAPGVTYRPPSKSPNSAQVRTPPGAPDLIEYAPYNPSAAQTAFRTQQAAARLRKIAGDLSMQGPGGSTGSPADRLRAALLRQERGYADGGPVEGDSSLAKISTFLKRYGGADAQRVGIDVAKQLYGLDENGNVVLGGQVGAHPVRPSILDQFSSLPAKVIPLANAIAGQSPADVQAMDRAAGVSDDNIPVPKWSSDAAARLAALDKRVSQTTGVGAPQGLAQYIEDAAASLVSPIPATGLAKEGSVASHVLPWVTQVMPKTAKEFGVTSAATGAANAGVDRAIAALAAHKARQQKASLSGAPALDSTGTGNVQTTAPGYARGGAVELPERPIQDLPRDEDGMFIQPDELTDRIAVWVEHNRMRAAHKAYYADDHCGDPKTVDKTGKYNCGGCNQADGNHCLWVYDDEKRGKPPLRINRRKGSCGPFEIIDRNDPEQRGNRIPASIAGYAVRVGGGPNEVFGCDQCWKGKKSKWAPLLARGTWCGEWGTTVQGHACCVMNGAKTVKR